MWKMHVVVCQLTTAQANFVDSQNVHLASLQNGPISALELYDIKNFILNSTAINDKLLYLSVQAHEGVWASILRGPRSIAFFRNL